MDFKRQDLLCVAIVTTLLVTRLPYTTAALCTKQSETSVKLRSSRQLYGAMLGTVKDILHSHNMSSPLSRNRLCNLSRSHAKHVLLLFNWRLLVTNTSDLHNTKRIFFFQSVEFIASEVTAQRAKKCSDRESYYYDIQQGLCKAVSQSVSFDYVNPKLELVITTTGNVLSICSMFALLILHCKLKISETLMGRNMVYLCLVLILMHAIQALSPVRQHNIIFCTISTILLHWLHIGALVWILFASLELYLQLQRPFYFQPTSSTLSPRCRLLFRITAFTFSSIVVIICLTINYIRSEDVINNSNNVCVPMLYWKNLLTFIIPVSLLLIVNTSCLVGCIAKIKYDPRIKQMDEDKNGERLTLTAIIFQTSTVIGLSWILGFTAKFTESSSVYLAFVLVSCLKGILVYVYVICKKWMWSLYRQIYEGRKQTRPKRSLTEFEVLV